MTPRALRSTAVAATVTALALLALPAAAGAAVGGPYVISGVNGVALAATPQTAGSALVVQVVEPNATTIVFTPAAVDFNPLTTGCDNVTSPGSTTCPRPVTSLTLTGAVVEAGVTGLISGQLTFAGGAGNDIFSVGGAAAIGNVSVAPGDGADSITIGGAIGSLALSGADPGNDRYNIQSTSLPVSTLALGAGNDVAANSSPNLRLEGGAGNDTLSGPGELVGDAGDDLIEPTVTTKLADGGPDVDRLSFELVGTNLTTVMTSPTTYVVNGSPKTNFETFEGGSAHDDITGTTGADTIAGGPGEDTATYDERTASEPLSITLATPGDDGAPGENDTLVGIEDVIGGASSDVLGGDAGPNVLVGGGGLNTIDGGAGNDTLIGGDFRDVIVGGPGSDTLIGGGDDDSLSAFDGEPDVVDCGPSTDDDAQVDAVDSVSGCEFSSRGDVPVPVDADHDGTVAGFDCNDNDPSIGLTAVDIPGDGIDQNCDGFDEPLALVTGGFRLTPSKPTAHGQRILTLVLTDLPGNSTVVATCKTPIKRRCPFTRVTRRPKRDGADVSLASLFKHRLLPVRTRIELRITAPGTIGRVRRFTVRKSAALGAADLCLLPGSSVAKRCPPDVL